MRDKTTILFNKCRILIEKTEFKNSVEVNRFEDLSKNHYQYNEIPYRRKHKWIPEKKTVIEKESPLGFVYTSTVIEGGHWEYIDSTNFKNTEKLINWAEYHIYVNNTKYKIVYPLSYDNKYLDNDTRPWDLIGEEMPTHFVNDLLTLTDELIQLFKAEKVNSKPHTYKYSRWQDPEKWAAEPAYDPWSLDEWKMKLYNDLYGNSKGPRFMTNEEKILAHGFDLKTSFRKI